MNIYQNLWPIQYVLTQFLSLKEALFFIFKFIIYIIFQNTWNIYIYNLNIKHLRKLYISIL